MLRKLVYFSQPSSLRKTYGDQPSGLGIQSKNHSITRVLCLEEAEASSCYLTTESQPPLLSCLNPSKPASKECVL